MWLEEAVPAEAGRFVSHLSRAILAEFQILFQNCVASKYTGSHSIQTAI